ncbi:hypothetical protein BDY21DRAFT_79063 [Lineolata rhizophorae]|uniref:4'-phosphopantetheinyl transferase domain-containing protein n=1 Tax=Lineolata rhizophorae TaxID=578093 RepID=A0A6A6NUC6_9PEZI|nr:hypothetical protein BDY21DRAFT_79063 [Lineolata rhizophorae]
MPLRPFPWPLRVGTDICYVPRIHQLITRGTQGRQQANLNPERFSRFLRKLFGNHEIRAFQARWPNADEALQNGRTYEMAQYIAARWAAKEAVIKANAPRKLGFHDIVIAKNDFREPIAIVLDKPWTRGLLCKPVNDIEERDSSHFIQCSDSDRPESGSENARKNHDRLNLESEGLHGQIARLSISHDGEYVTAACLAACEA